MTIPNLKRVKILDEAALRVWLTKNTDIGQSVMLVMFDNSSAEKFIEPEAVNAALRDLGWGSGRRYTLNGNLIGHVISPWVH